MSIINIIEKYMCNSCLELELQKGLAEGILNSIKAKPLVWDGSVSQQDNGCYYTAIMSRSGKSCCVDYVSRGSSDCLGYYPDWKAGKAAAEAHHQEAFKSNLMIEEH